MGLVNFPEVNWLHELRARVKGDERLLLVYNFDCYAENFTNPSGVLERLYLSLGHERFVHSVFVFGSKSCRYSCLPIRPLTDLGTFLDSVRPDGSTPPATLTGYYDKKCRVLGNDAKEPDRIFSIIRERFRIRPMSPPDARFLRFTIKGNNGPSDDNPRAE